MAAPLSTTGTRSATALHHYRGLNYTARCAVCGEATGEDGVIVDVLTAEGRHVYRALCSSDAACPTEIADVVRLMRTPPSPGR